MQIENYRFSNQALKVGAQSFVPARQRRAKENLLLLTVPVHLLKTLSLSHSTDQS